MGQRHQIYAIARVIPYNSKDKRGVYRCVAALHHQWCCGRSPPIALRRFLTLIKNPDHAKVVRQELKALDGKYGPYADEKPRIPDIPCPYLTFLLQSAWRVDLEERPPYLKGQCLVLPASMYTFNGDNNDGLTFIEITDPCDPAYCMTQFDTEILTAEQYVRSYYEAPTAADLLWFGQELEQDVIRVISLNANERLMTLEVLAEAWPTEYREAYVRTVLLDEEAQKSEREAPPVAVTAIPSLVDLTLAPAIEAILQSGQTELLSNLFLLPGKAALVKTALRTRKTVPDPAVSLLAFTITYQLQNEKVTDLDLTNFASWSSAQISQVISLIPQDILASVTTVDLSYNPQLSSCDIIEEILERIPSLRRLDVLDTSIDIPSLSSLISTKSQLFKYLGTLLHPALLQYEADGEIANGQLAGDPITHKSGFSCVFMRVHTSDRRYQARNNRPTAAYLPIWSLNMIIQSLTDLLSALLAGKPSVYSVFENAHLLQAAFGSTRDVQTQSWSQRHVPLVPSSSKLGFTGAGWMFVLTGEPEHAHWTYGFIKVDGEKLKTPTAVSDSESMSDLWKICDLDDFLRQAGDEGRPLPPNATVEELRQLLETMSDAPPIPPRKAAPTDCKPGLIDSETFARMVRSNIEGGSELSLAQCLVKLGT